MSCGMKGQLGTFVLWLLDSGNSKCKISWNHGAQWETSSLELFIVLFNDDSWAFQDLEDRIELKWKELSKTLNQEQAALKNKKVSTSVKTFSEKVWS